MGSEIFELSGHTHQCRIVMPANLNDHETLFGGELLKWMDEVAYITAKRFCRQEMVTVSADSIKFREPVFGGTIIELVGKIAHSGNASVLVLVEVFADSVTKSNNQVVAEGYFKFASVDKNHKIRRIQIP